ncbi:ImmA/IrrE family metallo-endopeptidase [Desulforamulus aquiferis]|uniref:ImmA/IrrE family metallo-endopeptidase n=1 Tax=Desulforamulus aquiferis TaxID=1397668 RepID=A0AAW7ZEV3_9FIRM|nr:ImmA/IrrE family metallo-endopeptidase [Desulforamulus aquiferis]MDO7787902.1 ImmA/IrrE family metallo-endopeptidase [Desulforamulus aquiferis]
MDILIKKLVKKYKTNCPFELAEHLNIIVKFEDLGKITKGFFHRRLRRNYIVLHCDETYLRQRFTCAHELGHYIFDRGTSYFMIQRNTLSLPGKLERRADHFAIKLLTFQKYTRSGESVEEFFRRLGIPTDMCKYY